MSLRARMGVASGVAVALAVIAVAISAYAGTRSELRDQVDQSLRGLAQPIVDRAQAPPGSAPGQQGAPQRNGPTGGGRLGIGAPDCDLGLGVDRGPTFGAAAGVKGFIAPNGSTCTVGGSSGSIPVDARARALAKREQGHYFTDVMLAGHHLRALAIGLPGHGALVVALPLHDVDAALSSQLLLLVVIAAAGIALAALLGILVARTALAPIARFTRRTESIAANPERHGQRLHEEGGDELTRLAQAFNATLDALERSIESQRNLVADASHELRTPIATLRANLQLMRDEARLSAEDREALREDMISELDELTGLVGDVVELARGSKPSGALGDVRVDAIVHEVAERTRRRAPELILQSSLQPTLVRGEAARIARAITNLLDNARKWSPPSGLVEVMLRDGTLTVRDHGPGFNDEDLPFVFDRFHRAPAARAKPGSGLGLAIVRQAAEAHGGSAVAANAPGGGALLEVSFGEPLEIECTPDSPAAHAAISRR